MRLPSLLPLLLFVWVCLPAHAQDTPHVVHDSAHKLAKDTHYITMGPLVKTLPAATGFNKDMNGRWVSRKGCIPFDNPEFNNPLYDAYHIGNDNYKYMNLYTVSIDSQEYYLLLMQYRKGEYVKIDTTREMDIENRQWKSWDMADFYVFEKAEWEKVLPKGVVSDTFYAANIHFKWGGNFPNNTPSMLRQKLEWATNIDVSDTTVDFDNTQKYLQIAMHPVKGKQGHLMRFNIYLAYAQEGAEVSEPDWSVFRYQYYQLPFSTFAAFARVK